MLVIHANWFDGRLHLWGESADRAINAAERSAPSDDPAAGPFEHPFAAEGHQLSAALNGSIRAGMESAPLVVWLPTGGNAPAASPRLAHATGRIAHGSAAERPSALAPWRVDSIAIEPGEAPGVLDDLEERAELAHERGTARDTGTVILADSARYFAAAARFARALIADQRFVPIAHADSPHDPAQARWLPWLGEEPAERRLTALLTAMPGAVRAAGDADGQAPTQVLEGFLSGVIDTTCRRALVRETMIESLDLWREEPKSSDPHVQWLDGLLGAGSTIAAPPAAMGQIIKQSRRWISGLEDRGQSSEWRLLLRLLEPPAPPAPAGAAVAPGVIDFSVPGEDTRWLLSFHLQAIDTTKIVVDAEDIWALRAETATVRGRRLDQPQDLLLGELGRATRLYPTLETALDDPRPERIELSTKQAYEFLREIRPILVEQGFGVEAPEWWDSPAARLGARLQLSGAVDDRAGRSPSAPGMVSGSRLGLSALVGYQWRLAIGETPLTLEEFEKLAAQRSPLVRIGGRWVEVRPEDVKAAVEFIRANPGGTMRLGDALHLAYVADPARTHMPITGVDAEGWLGDLLAGQSGAERMPVLEAPGTFEGSLRPYQQRGLSWLAFLDRMGFGPCLADDMGLGKTIQLLAMLLAERQPRENAEAEATGPTLLIVPMSIVGNWTREAKRFAPSLRVLVHHGAERLSDEALLDRALRSDLVVTTYSLVHRDREALGRIPWWRIVLDEAQNIKNPSAKQSQAVRALDAPRRVALTGTPLENRLSELWSIIDFCNPGLLGSPGEFRRSFALPIERHRDRDRARRLRALVQPFLLRRLKTDPLVISDLPEKVETKEYCRLTAQQAALYDECVKRMLSEVDRAEGIQRRGLVLTALIRLKQICNHPAQSELPASIARRANGIVALDPAADPDQDDPVPPALVLATDPAVSGKCIRLLEMLDEVVAEGAQALVFTQFRRMGALLAPMLRKALDREVLFLHGGTPQKQRDDMVETFQKGDGAAPIFILSLKAGGVGLNLTAATHVFHFDRWWNPAVENQATDRAFRIGQKKSVNVHKFIVAGTLEERIDQMIESKIALAEEVVGSGEEWLTELSTDQLREILALRPEAVADEGD